MADEPSALMLLENNDVEPQFDNIWMATLVGLGSRPQPFHLPVGNRLLGLTEAAVAARLDFNEYRGQAVAHNQVEFAVASSKVGLHKNQPALLKPSSRYVFAAPPERCPPGWHNYPAFTTTSP